MDETQRKLLEQRADEIRERREIEDQRERRILGYIQDGFAVLESPHWLYYPTEDEWEYLRAPYMIYICKRPGMGIYEVFAKFPGRWNFPIMLVNATDGLRSFKSLESAKMRVEQLTQGTSPSKWQWGH